MDFVSQQHWDESYLETEFSRPEPGNFLRLSLKKYIPPVQQGSAMEVGCYPGGYLSVLGDLGYELNGIDLTPKTKQLRKHLSEAGYEVIYIGLHQEPAEDHEHQPVKIPISPANTTVPDNSRNFLNLRTNSCHDCSSSEQAHQHSSRTDTPAEESDPK